MTAGAARCLRDELTEYATGRLDEAGMRRWDRHLVACPRCLYAVGVERRLQEAMASAAPEVPGTLRLSLLALGGPDRDPGAPAPVPAPWSAFGDGAHLRILTPTAPPMHRSALRSALIATAATAATAAAAWGIALTGSAAAAAPTGTPQPGASVGATVLPAAQRTAYGSGAASLVWRLGQGGGPGSADDRAQSSP